MSLVGRSIMIVMSKKQRTGSGEDRLIARYFKPLATHPGAFGLVDDAAAITPPAGCDLVLKTDGIVGGVHFFPDDPPDTVASKALRVNLSDLAAKGARPLGFLLTLALPRRSATRGSRRSRAGSASRCGHGSAARCSAATPSARPVPIMISIAAFGAVPHGKMVRRGRAPGRATASSSPARSATPRLGLLLRTDPRSQRQMGSRRRARSGIWRALSGAAAAQRHRRCCRARTRRPRWTSPTASSAISTSSAAPRA